MENPTASRPAISLYATTVLGTPEASKRVTDQTVAMLLPYVLKGLASSAADHRAATYLIVGQLARRSVLNKEFARELLIRVALVSGPFPRYHVGLVGRNGTGWETGQRQDCGND